MRFAVAAILLITLVVNETGCVKSFDLDSGIRNFHEGHYRKAFILLRVAAKKGQPDAQYAVGYMYYYGKGVIENRKKAWFWINRAAEAKQPAAITALDVLNKNPQDIMP